MLGTRENYKKALEDANTAIDLKHYPAYYEKGAALYALGKYDVSKECLKEALKHRTDRNSQIDFLLNEIQKWKDKNK